MTIQLVLNEILTSAAACGQPQRMFIKRASEVFNKKKKKRKKKLIEDIVAVRFKYKNYKTDPRPYVMVLDPEYKGVEGQSTYGKRNDLLGWNINYFKNREEAVNTINDITTFAKMLSSNNKETYERIKKFFPAQAEYIRRYNREYILAPKVRSGIFWKRFNIDSIKEINKDNF